MSDKSKIEWTDATWNPIRGCTPISAACTNCYARRFAKRFEGVDGHPYEQPFNQVRFVPRALKAPLGWKKPRKIFVCSMSDLFHDDVDDHWIGEVFAVMRECPQHTFQVLTKRADRLKEWSLQGPWPKNAWAGVTYEDSSAWHRIEHLREADVSLRYLSCEPLLGHIFPDLAKIDWVIAGGETGSFSRVCDPVWVRLLRDMSVLEEIPFFFKGWGGKKKRPDYNVLDGRIWQEFPDD